MDRGSCRVAARYASQSVMLDSSTPEPLHRKLIDRLYTEAMGLAEAARGYFDGIGREDRDALEPAARIGFSCESLKVTTRLMHVIAWILTQRAVEAGELSEADSRASVRRLGPSPESDEAVVAALPPRAAALTRASLDLHHRVERLDQMADAPVAAVSPVQMLQARLGGSF